MARWSQRTLSDPVANTWSRLERQGDIFSVTASAGTCPDPNHPQAIPEQNLVRLLLPERSARTIARECGGEACCRGLGVYGLIN